MLKAGDLAPKLKIPRLGSERPFDLHEELKKGPVMAVFLKESCPTCRFAVPLLNEAGRYASGGAGGMVFILQEMPWAAEQFAEEMKIEVPILLDEAPYEASDAFAIEFVPSAFYIKADGRIAVASESFERDTLAGMCESLAAANGRAPRPFYEEADQVPPFRPG